MKTCEDCGFRNFFINIDVSIYLIKCNNCGELLFKSENKSNPITSGNSVTKPKLLHDEMPWDYLGY